MDKWTAHRSLITGHTIITVVDKRGTIMQLSITANHLRIMTPQEFQRTLKRLKEAVDNAKR